MIIGSTNISEKEIERGAQNVDALTKLAVEKVPLLFRHIPEIVDNQKYYLALVVRHHYKNDFNKWKYVCDDMLRNVKVTGSVNNIYTCWDLLRACDIDNLCKYLGKQSR